MSLRKKKLSYDKIFFLGLFATILLYFLNCTPERTFSRPRIMEIIMIDTALQKKKVLYEWEKKVQSNYKKRITQMLQENTIISCKLNGSELFDRFILDQVYRLNKSIRKKDCHNLVVKVVFNKNSLYQDFIRCQNIAILENVQCYVMLDYDFYYLL